MSSSYSHTMSSSGSAPVRSIPSTQNFSGESSGGAGLEFSRKLQGFRDHVKRCARMYLPLRSVVSDLPETASFKARRLDNELSNCMTRWNISANGILEGLKESGFDSPANREDLVRWLNPAVRDITEATDAVRKELVDVDSKSLAAFEANQELFEKWSDGYQHDHTEEEEWTKRARDFIESSLQPAEDKMVTDLNELVRIVDVYDKSAK